jgi:CRP-like cAMP-binding protein
MSEVKEVRDYLHSISFFEGMSEEHIELISGCGSFRDFKEGEFLLKEGDKAGNFYFIREGEASVETYFPGQGSKTMMNVKPGEIAGYSWLFAPYRISFDVRAVTDIKAIEMAGVCLRGKSEADYELGYYLMDRMSQVVLKHLQATRRQLVNVYESMERKEK